MQIPKNFQQFKETAIQWQKMAAKGLGMCGPFVSGAANKAITGIVVAIPLIATMIVVKFVYGFINDLSAPFLKTVGLNLPLLPFFVTVALLIGLGLMATNVLGQRVLESMEQALLKIPFVASVYAGVKQVIDSFKAFNNMSNFKRVVYVDYPGEGCRLIGFVTGQFYDSKLQQELVTVVIPTAPNPMTGLVIIVPIDKLVDSSLTLEEAMKMVVSAGLVVPKRRSEPVIITPVPHLEA